MLVQLGKVAEGQAVSIVPCGTCNACCWYGRTDVVLAEETPENLEVLEIWEDDEGGTYSLAHREDGACFHLGQDGRCSVWEHRPQVCRNYDCRAFGLAGLTPNPNGHRAPDWQFPITTPLDRAIILAATMTAQPYVDAYRNGTAPPDGNVLAAVLEGIHNNLPAARAVIHRMTGE